MAINILFELIEQEKYDLVWSFILEYENVRNPFLERKLHINYISSICKDTIKPDENIKILAKDLVRYSNIKDKDALHLRKEMNIDVIE